MILTKLYKHTNILNHLEIDEFFNKRDVKK